MTKTGEALHLRALARAIELSGGPEQLAAHLKMRPSQLTFMLQGTTRVPDDVFLQIVDLLNSHDIGGLTR